MWRLSRRAALRPVPGATPIRPILADRTPERRRTVHLRAAGTSMAPAIADGDTLVIETIDSEGFRPGQIVAFWGTRSQLIAHRVCWVDRRRRRLFTMGDAVAFPDRALPLEAVLGVVTAVIAADGSLRHACLLSPPWRRGWRWLARRLVILVGREAAPSRVLRRLGLPTAKHSSEVVRYERVASAVPPEPGGDREQS